MPPINGFVLQVAAVLRELRRAHDVRVVALRFPDQELTSRDADEARYVSSPYAGSLLSLAPRLIGVLDEEIERFRPDVVHVAGAYLASLGHRLQAHAALLVPLDAAHVNAEARALRRIGPSRFVARRRATRIRRFEAAEYPSFRRVVVVSDADRAALTALAPGLRVAVVPNGVDTTAFAPDPEVAVDATRIIFAGVMEAAPNISAAEVLAREVMPRVRALVPEARLAVVGRAPVAAVRRLAREPGVDIVGEVDDMRRWLTTSRVCACPMVSGTGIKNKILEALASGVPCVVTPRALGGLRALPGRDVLVAETPDEFAAAIVHVLRDDDAARALGAAGRAYVVAEHDWGDVGDAFVEIYERVIAETRSGTYKSLNQV